MRPHGAKENPWSKAWCVAINALKSDRSNDLIAAFIDPMYRRQHRLVGTLP